MLHCPGWCGSGSSGVRPIRDEIFGSQAELGQDFLIRDGIVILEPGLERGDGAVR